MQSKNYFKSLSLIMTFVLLFSFTAIVSSAATLDLNATATYGEKLADVELPDGYAWQNMQESVGNVGTNEFEATYTPDGGTAETVSVAVKVSPAYISEVSVTTDGSLYYTGVPVEPTVKAVFKGIVLVKDRDYTVSYLDNDAIGTARMIIEGTGNFKGKSTITFYILKIDVESVNISQDEIELAPEKTYHLTANVTPSNATYKGITWTSSDENVATVDENGMVTAIADGVATITATSNDGGYTSTCTVNVLTRVANVQLGVGTVKMRYKDTYNLKATVNPWNATDTSIVWTSSDEEVVTVDENGTLTSVGKGFATITATTVDGEFVDTCEVEVYYSWWQCILWVLFGCIWYF